MGFLPSNFQNLMLTRLIAETQRQLTSNISRTRTAKRQAESVEKNITNALRMNQNQIRAEMSNSIFNLQASGASDPTRAQQEIFSMQTQMQTQLANLERDAEVMKEMQVQPLTDLASDLEVEKEKLEGDIKMYQSWKEGAKEDVQSSAKNLKPNYGSGG